MATILRNSLLVEPATRDREATIEGKHPKISGSTQILNEIWRFTENGIKPFALWE